MYVPKTGDPVTPLWFISGVGLLQWNRYDLPRQGSTCFLTMLSPAPRHDRSPAGRYRPAAPAGPDGGARLT
jgi:hypothetical protein